MLENAWYYLALKSEYDLAGALHHTQDQAAIQQQMDALAKAYRVKFRTAAGVPFR